MSAWRKFVYLLPWKRRAEDREMQEELAALRDIAGPRELGNLTLAAEDARAEQSWMGFERLRQDVRYAVRSMAHHKAFTALVVLSLGLGIGANTAIYSFMEAILLRPLPVHEPEQLVIMKWRAKSYALARSGMSWSTGGTTTSRDAGTLATNFPYPALDVFASAGEVVSSAFAYFQISRIGVTVGDQTDSLRGQYVSGTYFSGMGVPAVAGRLIQPADDAVGAPAVAVISERFSQRRFGAAEGALGQIIRLNDKPFQVIGVAPSDFFGAEAGAVSDVYVPMRADSILEPAAAATRYTDQYFFWTEIMGRLQPGVTLEQAQAALAPRFHQYVAALATEERERADLPVLSLESGAAGLDTLRRRYALPIYVLLAMVGLILLIACANAANLLLSRATARRREIAVRLSIGASRGRVIRQLLTESLVLASMAGALGLLIAWWGIGLLTALLATGRDHFTLHAALNPMVLAMTAALSCATGVLFGLVPALQATRIDVAPALKEARVSPALRHRGMRLGPSLVVAQVVFSLVLIFAAALFGRTVWRLHAIEAGFDRENVLLFSIRPSAVGYKGDALPELYERLRTELASLPGIIGATNSTSALPMGGGTMGPIAIEGGPPPPLVNGRPATAVFASVGPSFFTTMRMPVVGRDIGDRDRASAPKVVVVNRRLGRLFGLEQPIGRTLIVDKERYEIVGVTEDALSFSLKEEPRPAVYFAHLQASRPPGGVTFEVRTAGDPMGFAAAGREAVRRVDARLAIHDMKSQATHIDQGISTEITLARLCAAFAGLALVIACVGLYGTVAFNVSRRTNEIGIRVTLGAQRGRILWMILREVLVLTTVGLAIGVPLALASSRYVQSLLYGIEPTDPVAIAIGIAALVTCGLAAGLIPARRASRIDPMVAVRHD
jgi:predicted permease